MNKPPLFSIITITKNNERGLHATQESLQQQTQQNFEWVVVDGGVSNGNLLLQTFTSAKPHLSPVIPAKAGIHSEYHSDCMDPGFRRDDKITYVNEPDSGIYDAMNKGIERSKGDYLLFLNAGDILAENGTLAEIAAHIAASKTAPDFIYGDAREGTPERSHYKKARPHTMAALGMFTHHQSMLYRRNLLENLRYSPIYKIAGDYDFTLRFLQQAQHIIYISRPLCLFEPGGVSQQNAARGRKEQFHIRRDLHISNALENAAIYLVHMLSRNFRQRFPALYWRLRKNH